MTTIPGSPASDPSDSSDPVFRAGRSDPSVPSDSVFPLSEADAPRASDASESSGSSDSVFRAGGSDPSVPSDSDLSSFEPDAPRASDASDSSDPLSGGRADAGPSRSELLDAAVDAALALADERPWRLVTLRDIADAAALPFVDLYIATRGKTAVLAALSRRLDRAALQADVPPGEDAHDRLFEAVMARVEAMEPHRVALVSIARDEGALGLGPHFPVTARAMLESAGIDTAGPRGAARVLAMAAVWARIAQVWRDDEGALNRTMAEIDKRLKDMRRRLDRVNAGF